MRVLLPIVLSLVAVAAGAHAGELCAPGAKHRGRTVDLDLVNADIRDVLRLLADTANINLVVGDSVTGKVTMKLRRVAWDAAACTIAATHRLAMTVEDNILLVTAPAK
jgi:type IV pilus assembly protein PilQ